MVPQFMARFDKPVLLNDLPIGAEGDPPPLLRLALCALASASSRALGIELEIEDLAAALVAEQAAKETRTGARALRTSSTSSSTPSSTTHGAPRPWSPRTAAATACWSPPTWCAKPCAEGRRRGPQARSHAERGNERLDSGLHASLHLAPTLRVGALGASNWLPCSAWEPRARSATRSPGTPCQQAVDLVVDRVLEGVGELGAELLRLVEVFLGLRRVPPLQLDAAEHQVDLGDPGVEPASAPHQRLRFVQPAVLEGFERLLGQVVGVARLLVEGVRLHPRGVAGALGEPVVAGEVLHRRQEVVVEGEGLLQRGDGLAEVPCATEQNRVVVPRVGQLGVEPQRLQVVALARREVAGQHRLRADVVEVVGDRPIVADHDEPAVDLGAVGHEVDGVQEAVDDHAADDVGAVDHRPFIAVERSEVLDLDVEGPQAGAARQGDEQVDQRQAVAGALGEGLAGGEGGVGAVGEAEAVALPEDALDDPLHPRSGFFPQPRLLLRHRRDLLVAGVRGDEVGRARRDDDLAARGGGEEDRG